MEKPVGNKCNGYTEIDCLVEDLGSLKQEDLNINIKVFLDKYYREH